MHPLEQLQEPDLKALGVREQIEAMQQNYLALWRLFVFVRPEYLVPRNDGETANAVLNRCRGAVHEFLRWAHSEGNPDARLGDVPGLGLNCLRLEEVISSARANCRDVRWAFPDGREPLEDSEERDTVMLEMLDQPTTWRNEASRAFPARTVRGMARLFDEEGIADNTIRLRCIERLNQEYREPVTQGLEAARDATQPIARLRQIIEEERSRS